MIISVRFSRAGPLKPRESSPWNSASHEPQNEVRLWEEPAGDTGGGKGTVEGAGERGTPDNGIEEKF